MTIAFALNHMAAPRLPLRSFFDAAVDLGIRHVEIRNDLDGHAILDGTPAADIRAMAAARDLSIVSINALQRFNAWTPERAQEAAGLIAFAKACGAQALVLCPVNDLLFQPAAGERLGGLRDALAALAPMLRDAGLVGLVEPLGFVECSLRLKREAVEAIDAVGAADAFRLVHDTFHHHVAGDADLFADRTGLAHISGVVDPGVSAASMRDPHRILVDAGDRIDNVGQIAALLARGYDGLFSFEPFADSVAALADPRAALRASMAFLTDEVHIPAA